MSVTPAAGWIEPVPTEYAGVMFRSRLEALWAASLDQHGIKWEYEPTGAGGSPSVFDLPSGAVYQPDFWLPEVDGFVEVKGGHFQRVDKAREFAREMAPEYIVVLGLAPERREDKTRFEPVMSWFDATGLGAQFGRCQCGAAQWWRPRVSLDCKRCGQRADSTVRLEQEFSGAVPFLARRDDVAHDWLFRRMMPPSRRLPAVAAARIALSRRPQGGSPMAADPAPARPAGVTAAPACRHCRRPIVRCDTQPGHIGCSSGHGWIHSEPGQWGHSCRPRSGAPYAQPEAEPQQ